MVKIIKVKAKIYFTESFGNFYLSLSIIKRFCNKFVFLKIILIKKFEHQSIVDKESGFIIDNTKNNYLTYHLRPKNSEILILKAHVK